MGHGSMALIRPILPWVGKLEQHVAYFQTGNVIYLKTKTSLVIQYILIAAPKSAIMFMENAREYLFLQMSSHKWCRIPSWTWDDDQLYLIVQIVKPFKTECNKVNANRFRRGQEFRKGQTGNF